MPSLDHCVLGHRPAEMLSGMLIFLWKMQLHGNKTLETSHFLDGEQEIFEGITEKFWIFETVATKIEILIRGSQCAQFSSAAKAASIYDNDIIDSRKQTSKMPLVGTDGNLIRF